MFPRANSTLLLTGAAVWLAGCAPSREEVVAGHEQTVARYCTSCHDDIERTADLSLESLPFDAVAAHPAEWEKVVRKLRAGMMPPVGEPRPTAEARVELASWLESELDAAAAANPNPGRTEPFHRLNRAEYRNAIRDLLHLDVEVAELLPADEASYGFDNIAGVLKLSPTLLERYLAAADKVSRLAVGTPSQFVNIDWFRVPDDRSQEKRLPGLPFGTRGGTLIDYHFPADAEYEIAVELARDLNEGMPLYAEEQTLEIAVDGERLALFTLPAVPLMAPQAANNDPNAPAISQIVQRFQLDREGRAARNRADADWRVRVPVSAGQHTVTATFLARTAALDEPARLPFERPYPAGVNIPETRTGSYLRAVEISGPYEATGAGETASRERIFSCRPEAGAEAAEGEACANEILSTLARRAYRRPVAADDVAPLLEFYRDGAEHGFDLGIQLALKRLLVSPEFLFRVEQDPAGASPGSVYAVPDLTLASRLSFFLWSSIPDDELLESAERGELRDPNVLTRQVQRMLADRRATAFVENFAGQWLYLRNLDAVVPVQSVFPDFDDTLRQGLKRETELFFGSIVQEDRSALDLLRADYTFVNERVARLYGLPNVKGNHFRRVTLPADSPRRGLLGHGSILTVTSYPDRTSPVVRGKWILENLLGVPPPPPPADVPELEETSDGGGTLSIRERLAAHRANPSCASCHALMDPLGFALENFNAVGVWRTIDDTGGPIDASGTLPDGEEFSGPEELRAILVEQREAFARGVTAKLLTYALGRGLERYDTKTVRAIAGRLPAQDYRFSALVLEIVNSLPFQARRPR
ncbi:MAG: DUF1592 domain-containing protein [Lysobacterales bacterium]|nr:MAG: DUF1592 domain-containing protein [Xanthomonadales bacterium]